MTEGPGGQALLYVDRHLLHEGSTHALARLGATGRRGAPPRRLTSPPPTTTCPPTPGAGEIADPEIRAMVDALDRHTRGARHPASSAAATPRQGIVHVIGPEQGSTQPGITLIVRRLPHRHPRRLRRARLRHRLHRGRARAGHAVPVAAPAEGDARHGRRARGPGVEAKDVILALIAQIGAGGGVGHALEYAGAPIRAMSMDERMTVCNMSIEAGARAGMVAPDETTFAYLEGRPFAPRGDLWPQALAYWQTLPSDPDARLRPRGRRSTRPSIAPTVTWGTSPQDALPITGRVPDPARWAIPAPREHGARARLHGAHARACRSPTPVDRVFIGSCTNSRLEDLRAAAAIGEGRRAAVPGVGGPGLGAHQAAAEAEGLDRVFTDAGFEWREPGCSMCVGMNGDTAARGRARGLTSNRNFEGRQGQGARTHLMSPAMAAAAAVTGRLTDVRTRSGDLTWNPSPPHRASPCRSTCRTWTPTASSPRASCASRGGRLRPLPLPRRALRRRGAGAAGVRPEPSAVPAAPILVTAENFGCGSSRERRCGRSWTTASAW